MRIGVLGCGSIGRRHIGNLIALGIRPDDISVYDPDASACHQAALDLGVVDWYSIRAVVGGNSNAVLICSPPQFHVEQAMAVAERGCHVFIEKPLSHSMESVQELGNLLDANGLVNMVACQWRFDRGLAEISRAIDIGLIGRIGNARLQYNSCLRNWRQGYDWRNHFSASPEYGGVLLEVGSHWIDLAMWFMGTAQLEWADVRKSHDLGLNCDAWAELLLNHDLGCNSRIHMDFESNGLSSNSIVIEGDYGELAWPAPAFEKLDPNQKYLEELRHFLNCCQSGHPSCNPVRQAINVQEIIMEARACLKQS